MPDHLKTLLKVSMNSSHYCRQHWYWWGEAHFRSTETKLELTSIPESEWKTVEDEALKFWDETAETSERNARVIEILKGSVTTMGKAGPPYQYA